MILKFLILALVDLLIVHGIIILFFKNYKDLVAALSRFTVPINFVPLRKDLDYSTWSSIKVLLIVVILGSLIAIESFYFYNSHFAFAVSLISIGVSVTPPKIL